MNLLLRDFVKPAPRRRGAGCAASRAASARSTSPRRSGSATRSATWRSRTSCASSIPTSRSTGWPSTRSRRCSRRAASGSIPASAFLANESHHIESESAEHDLHCFQAIRRMDEILLSNFMVFHDLVREEQYDLWIGDEAWELDYYLHENPEQKRAPYVWLTDFVGWLPMPDGGDHEAFLTGDYNEEMIEHIARFPRVRDQAVFVGNPDDIVPERFASAPAVDPRVDRGALLVRGLRHGLRSRRVRRPRGAQGRARLRRRRAGLHRHRRRLGRRRRPPAAGDRRVPGGEGAGAGAADGRRRRAADRPGDAAGARRARGARLRARALPAPRRLRPRRRPGRPDDVDGADREPAPVPLLPAPPPLRAELPRPPPARPLRRRPPHGLRARDAGDDRRRDRRDDRPATSTTAPSRRTGPRGPRR